MSKKFLAAIGVVDSHLSIVDWLWRLFTFLVIAGGGTVAGILAQFTQMFGAAGYLAWMLIGVATSLALACCFALIRYSGVKGAEKQYVQAMALKPTGINPLQDSFADAVIHIHDLYLPGIQLHEGKHFKRCIFVGPGTIAMLGGTYSNSSFMETGQVIPIPENTYLTGTVLFKHCTVDQCTFIRVTLLAPVEHANAFNKAVSGSNSSSKFSVHSPSRSAGTS